MLSQNRQLVSVLPAKLFSTALVMLTSTLMLVEFHFTDVFLDFNSIFRCC